MIYYNQLPAQIPHPPGAALPRIRYIHRQDKWEQAAETLANQPILALDTESNSLYAYHDRLCLIQIAHPDGIIILDPLAVADLSSLGRILADPQTLKTIHGASYDLTSLYRQHRFRVENLFDTELAARFLGLPQTNLAAVLQTGLQISIPKNPALQRSDWSLRPLPPQALAYAAADVTHLTELAAELRSRLQKLARLNWVLEECQRLTQTATQPAAVPDASPFLRTRGANRLNPRQLAILQEIWLIRETEAQRRNLPPFKIMNTQTLLQLAQYPHPDNYPYPALPPGTSQRLSSEIVKAIVRGWSVPEYHRPPDRKFPQAPGYATRLRGLKNWRQDQAAALQIHPSLIWPTRSLERIAEAPPQPCQLPDGDNPDIRQWQRREFGPQLGNLCDSPQWRQGKTVTPPAPPKPAPVAA